MAKVLVTGGTGFIGSHLCEALLEKGDSVVCFDNMFRGKEENIKAVKDNKNFELLEGDIRDLNQVKKAVEDCDIVHHLAAINGTKYFYEKPILIADVNINGTLNVLNACKEADVKRVTFASSPEVYGEAEKIPTPESAICRFDNPVKTLRHSYATSKYLGDVLSLAFKEKFNLPVTVLRYFNIYGPRLVGTEYGQVVSIFIKNALEGKSPVVHGDGEQTRSFTYIDDAIDATIKASESGKANGEALNIGMQKETTINELAQKVLKVCNSDLSIEHDEELAGDCKRRCPDTSKIKELIGWEAKTDLGTGLEKTVEWFKGQK